MKKQILHLGVNATNKCNRGCKHCLAKATDAGIEFSKAMWVRKLVTEAKDLGFRVSGSISGFGEPLMHPKIFKLAQAFTGLKVCRNINITSSGFLKKDLEEKQRFMRIVNSYFSRIVDFNFSFNLYSASFPERLEQTLGLLLRQKKYSFTDILIRCDRSNYFKTHLELHDLFACMQTKLGMNIVVCSLDRKNERFRAMIPHFLSQEYDQEQMIQLAGDALYIPFTYRFESKKLGVKHVRFKTSFIDRLGNAENLPERSFVKKSKYCGILTAAEENETDFYMDSRGNIFPGCNCMHSGLSIGTWRTPLRTMIERKQALRKKMLRYVMADFSLEWGDFPCHECAAIAKRNFSFVNDSM